MREVKRNQNLVPKDMGNGSTQPSKLKLALKKRQQNGLNTASKPKIPITALKAQKAS